MSSYFHVILCGPSGSGKTTLADRLKGQQQLSHYERINEVARDVMRTMRIERVDLEKSLSSDGELFHELQVHIAREQCERERALENRSRVFISDRGPDYLVYTLLHRGERELQKLAAHPEVQESLARYRRSVVVLVAPHTQHAEDDGTRLIPCPVEHDLFRGVLVRFRVAFIDLCCTDLRERVEIVLAAVDSRSRIIEQETDHALEHGKNTLNESAGLSKLHQPCRVSYSPLTTSQQV